jgi:hypothetical protein
MWITVSLAFDMRSDTNSLDTRFKELVGQWGNGKKRVMDGKVEWWEDEETKNNILA